MHTTHTIFSTRRAALVGCTALATVFGFATAAIAADAAPAPTPVPAQADATAPGTTVAEIVVTAQKRQQNQQDVPISLTAVSASALQANRITSVVDLGTVVPNLAARPTAGGAQTPAFTMRGVTSYGVVGGSDKEISVYIDGVYVASSVGSSLDLPEVSQIEVLRGPQGTLFGRNATVGAVSVITRDPPSKFGIAQDFTYGNYREFRSKTRLDFGSFGDFSASISFVHDQRRGDMENLGAGTTFTYPSSSGYPTTLVSPKYLGDKNLNSVFAAVKYEPSSNFKVVNKLDWSGNHYTPTGAAVVGYDPLALGIAPGSSADFLTALATSQAVAPTFDTSGKRPDAVNNSFSTPSYVRDWGDNLNAELRLSDNLSLKNVAAFRESYLRAANQLDGYGGLDFTQQAVHPYATFAAYSSPGFFSQSPAVQQAIIAGYAAGLTPLVGSPFGVFPIQQLTYSHQWSDELQVNYNTKALKVTAGFMYFYTKGQSGGPPGLPNDIEFEPVPFANYTYLNQPSREFYANRSLAAYVQSELHVTSNVELVGGIRATNDRKTGSFVDGAGTLVYTPYSKTLPSYTVGVNYKPTSDILIYAKYSTAFVSGGASGPVSYLPEKAYSFEAGVKSDWFNHRFRANFSAFDVKYHDLQTAQSGTTINQPEISLVVADLGDERAKGFELETTLVPIGGLTIGAAAGYTDAYYTRLNGAITEFGAPITLQTFFPTLQPKWTANLSAQYDTREVIWGGSMTFRVDAAWRDKELTDGYAAYQALPQYSSLTYAPATWLLNSRVALQHIKLPAGEGTIAIWAKNLTNDRSITFPDITGGIVGSTEFQPARTFGIDVSFKY